MTPEQFREYGHQLIDMIADYRNDLSDFPVMSTVSPGSIKQQLPTQPPVNGEDFQAVFQDMKQIIMPGLSHWQHPGFFGYFPSNSELSSVLGDYLSTGLGVLGLSWQSSPAMTEVEEVATDWMRQMVGLSEGWQGVIQDTASTSTLVALISAREKASQYALVKGGLQAQRAPLMIYVSAHAHSSVDKGALLAGFGKDNIRYIETDADFSMIPSALAKTIADDIAAGLHPCAVVATTGTTTTTAVDPLSAIGDIAHEYGIWFHVDSAMAGSAMILPECRWMWDGIEKADSLVLNAHKWLGATFDLSLYYVKDPEHLIRVMSTNPSYLQSNVDSEVKNLRDWGIPLGRRFRALKLWCLIRDQGVTGLQKRLRRDMANAQWFAKTVSSTPDWEVLAPVHLQTVCIRFTPNNLPTNQLDDFTKAWADALNHSGLAYVTPATLNGQWMVRISIGAINTEEEHVKALWANILQISQQVLQQQFL